MPLVVSPSFPVSFELSGVERYFDTAARNKTNALQAKVTKHQAEHSGSPTRAMSILDGPASHNPRIFKRGNPGDLGRGLVSKLIKQSGLDMSYTQFVQADY